ncbi:Ig-like domain-containing protein [Paraburkholderia tropica]
MADDAVADGVSENSVTFKALTHSGAAAQSAPITIAASSETAVVTPVRGDAGGEGVPVTIRNTVAETVTLTATLDADDEIATTVDVTFGEPPADSTPGKLSITVDTDNAPADGVTADRITVTAKNAAGDVVNAAVTLTTTGSATFGVASGNTGTEGLASNVTDDTAETVTVTATLDSGDTITATAELTFTEVQK